MYIHKEGRNTIIIVSTLLVLFSALTDKVFTLPYWLNISIEMILVCLLLMILWFFRIPKRKLVYGDNFVVASSDGKVVIIEKTFEPEYFQSERIQVSVFMSPLNVHVQRYPINGLVKFFKYHPGKYLVAWHPKSSTLNERTTVVLEHKNGREVLVRQIAGAVARRIVCYSKADTQVKQNEELGFIKFGSRVDFFLPLDAEILVKEGDVVKGGQTVIAKI